MRLVIYREPLASQVPTNVGKDGVMAGNPHVVSTGAYLQDMVISRHVSGIMHPARQIRSPCLSLVVLDLVGRAPILTL